jgi:hypothetical protein
MIKSYRGKIADGGVERIRLSTKRGEVGYKVVKLQILPPNPANTSTEHMVQILRQEPVNASGVPTASNTVDFSNPLLIGVAYFENSSGMAAPAATQTVIFDSEPFNQDIYVSHMEENGSEDCNYYLELEQIKLDLNQSTVATLKDMRGRE